MTCVNCSAAIERVTSKIEGVKSAKVSFASASGEFEISNDEIKQTLIKKIKKLGYDVADNYEEYEQKRKEHIKILLSKLILAAILSSAIMLLEMTGIKQWQYSKVLALILGATVLIYSASGFYKQAIQNIKERSYGMSVLVALGATAAFIYSTLSVFLPNLIPQNMAHSYIGGASMIVTFVLFGKYLEERSKAGTAEFLRSLANLAPKMAIRIKSNAQHEVVPVSELKLDDVVVVKTGESVPSDGIIMQGGAELDTSSITGEMLAKYKTVGDKVYAGYINTSGFISVKVTALAKDTLLNQIVALLTQAGTKQAPIARLADRVSNIFVPTVVGISILTLIIWSIAGNTNYGILCAISVLIISCPCALGLATPIAVIASISRAAKDGILIKNPEVIELMQDIKFAVFDKTGTLTQGKITINSTDINDKDMSIIAAAESLSEHPISKAITQYASKNQISFSDLGDVKFTPLPGRGMIASLIDGDIIVGNKALLEEKGIEIPKNTNGDIHAVIYSRYAGSFSIKDEIHSQAKQTITDLRNLGIKSVMMTGDSKESAQKVASALGVDEVFANMLPTHKLTKVKELKNKGKVLFVGDGINDAVSLKEADVGIAMGTGTELAKNSGDIVLVNSKLSGVAKAVYIGRESLRIIRQNLFWAFAYNAICIPVAAGVLYPVFGIVLNPAYGALAMCFSSVSVILNSLRIKGIKTDDI